VLLSFSDAYADRARDIARQLESCGLRVRYDPWAGGAGLSPSSAVDVGLEGVACVVPMLTPSEATATWLDDAWKRTVFEPARASGIAVLPAWCDGELDAAPDFIRIGSFANLRDADRAHELKRLVETIKESTGDGRIDSSPLVVGAGDSDTGGGRDATGVRRDAVEAAPGHAIVVEIGREIAERVPREGAGGWDEAWLPMMRDGLYFELGVKFPEVRWLESAELAPWDFRILINDVPERRHSMRPDAVLVNDTVQAMAARGIDATPGINPANEGECAWIPASDADGVEASGLTTWGVAGFLVLSLSAALRRRAVAFLGVGEVAAMLRQAGEAHPQLVEEAVPKTVPLFVLADVLRRLVAEGVCVRNLRRILLTLADRGRREQDPLLLSEYARAALQREITHRLSRGSKQLIVLLLDPAIEDILRRAVEHTATGSYLKLEPSRLQQVLAAIREPMSVFPSYAQVPQILTVLEIRAVVRRLVAASMPALHVLSYDELMPDADVQPVGRITLDGFQARPGVRVGDRLLWG
jgi:hypothetical protein